MKKILMMALMAIVALGAYADDEPEFTVTSGSFVDVVRQPGKTATVEFNYLDDKTGNLRSKSLTDKTLREKLATEDEDVYKDWDDILENSKEYFVKRWNEEKKKNVKMLEKGKGDYHFVFTASAFDTGNAGASYWSVSKRDGGITVNAILEIKDASGQTVCTVKIHRYRGASSRNLDFKFPNFKRRMQMFHKSLAKDLLEDVNK